MNKIILLGNFTKDPEFKNSKNGTPYATFCLAVKKKYQINKETKNADFIHCIAWDKSAEIVMKFGKKGIKALIEGELNMFMAENNTIYKVKIDNIEFLFKVKDDDDFADSVIQNESNLPF